MDNASIEQINTRAPALATESREVHADGLDKMISERAANNVLCRTDPDALKAKLEASMPENICCFCHSVFRGFGNNPDPLLADGTACDLCNLHLVMRARYQACAPE